MPTTLRQRQKQLARESILQSTADLIVDDGLEALSLTDVAARAGVSKRTLYNYFDSREILLAELCRWSDELTLELGGALVPQGLDTLPETVRAVWRTWAAQGTIYQATLKIEAASNPAGVSDDRRRRRAALARAIEDIRPDLGHDDAHAIAAVLHAIVSPAVFERLTAQDGLTVDRAGQLVAWVVATMRDALRTSSDPFTEEYRS